MEHERSIEVKVKDEKEFSWTRWQAPYNWYLSHQCSKGSGTEKKKTQAR
jgi:hypothetical protein